MASIGHEVGGRRVMDGGPTGSSGVNPRDAALDAVVQRPVPRLADFSGVGYDRGRSLPWQALWWVFANLCWQKWWFPAGARPAALRLFGARIGSGCVIRSRVRVHWPWKLSMGDSCWIGEGAWVLNLEPVDLGHDVCISQDALICTGSHDFTSPTFEFDNGAVSIGDGAWIAARATVLRGVSVGRGAVVGAGSVVYRNVEPFRLHVR